MFVRLFLKLMKMKGWDGVDVDESFGIAESAFLIQSAFVNYKSALLD